MPAFYWYLRTRLRRKTSLEKLRSKQLEGVAIKSARDSMYSRGGVCLIRQLEGLMATCPGQIRLVTIIFVPFRPRKYRNLQPVHVGCTAPYWVPT